MPRIYASDNDPYDFCAECFPGETRAKDVFGYLGDGPDGRGNCYGYDSEHPNYDFENYKCYRCGARLTGEDN